MCISFNRQGTQSQAEQVTPCSARSTDGQGWRLEGIHTFRSSCYSPSFQPECEATGEVPPPTYTSSEEEREDEEEVIEEGDEEEECSEGYVNSPSGECEDWDECSEGNGGCEESCMNKPGTYECTCPQVIQQPAQSCSTYPFHRVMI